MGEKIIPEKEPWATVALKATAGEPTPCCVQPFPAIITTTNKPRKEKVIQDNKVSLPISYLELRNNINQLTPGHFGKMQS